MCVLRLPTQKTILFSYLMACPLPLCHYQPVELIILWRHVLNLGSFEDVRGRRNTAVELADRWDDAGIFLRGHLPPTFSS